MNVKEIAKKTYCGLATHHSDRGIDIRQWSLMARLGLYMSAVLVGLIPGILAYEVITPQSVVGWLLTGTFAVSGYLLWLDHGKLRFPEPVRTALLTFIYSWFVLAFLLLLWPISVGDIIAVSLGIAGVVVFWLVATGIPAWVWRGSDAPSWALTTNQGIKRPITNPIGSILGSTIGEALAVSLVILGFWLLLLV